MVGRSTVAVTVRRRTIRAAISYHTLLSLFEMLKRRVFVCVCLSEAVTPSLMSSADEEIIVMEGETIEISCVIDSLRKYGVTVCCLNSVIQRIQ